MMGGLQLKLKMLLRRRWKRMRLCQRRGVRDGLLLHGRLQWMQLRRQGEGGQELRELGEQRRWR